MRAVASGVGDCCRQWAWLLKYIIYVMLLISNELVPTHTNSEFVRVRFEFAAINSAPPATAARQGGRVAASRVDSCEFRTADKRRYHNQI